MGCSDCCYRQEFEEGSGHTLECKRRGSKHNSKSLQRNFNNASGANMRNLEHTNRRKNFVSQDALIFVFMFLGSLKNGVMCYKLRYSLCLEFKIFTKPSRRFKTKNIFCFRYWNARKVPEASELGGKICFLRPAIILGVNDEECNLDQAPQDIDKEKA
ncbi:hypothetical protein NPIL_421201 [Nephila pilipes]|uniref:Uncharacterized protein n=1 Tax=Nephila pilipes TaxID=299642 RepID=A0A8X6MP04_NEPPI|nr:hypothetical protein NPIL_421201 [Nephila pilipes]